MPEPENDDDFSFNGVLDGFPDDWLELDRAGSTRAARKGRRHDDGAVLASPQLSEKARATLGLSTAPRLLGLRNAHYTNLALHRTRYGF